MADGHTKSKISKWKNAFKALKYSKVQTEAIQVAPGDSKGRRKSLSPAPEQSGDVDPTYLLLKQASQYYKKKHEEEKEREKEDEQLLQKDSTTLIKRKTSVPTVEVTRVPTKYVGSKSNASFTVQRSFESMDLEEITLPTRSVSTTAKPKLSVAMKSVSLDTPDLEPARTNKLGKKTNSKNKRFLQSKIWNSSVETDETRSEKSSPSCSQDGSTQSLSLVHVVTHSNQARLPEELELQMGNRMVVMDTSDPEWWHGYKYGDTNHRLGVFPATCVSVMFSGERPMKLAHNLSLASTFKVLRLYRDQIVFVSPEHDSDGMVLIRTDKNYKAFCPPTALRPVLQ